MLDLIQVFVEALDACFKNVCELDIVFNSEVKNSWMRQFCFLRIVVNLNCTSFP
mgnify:CR=1 FL=1